MDYKYYVVRYTYIKTIFSQYTLTLCTYHTPLTEAIRVNFFENPDSAVFLPTLLSGEDSVTHVKTCLKFWGLPRKCV